MQIPIPSVGEDAEQLARSYTAAGSAKAAVTLESSLSIAY